MATPIAGPDESVQNLERFIAVLRTAIDQVHEQASAAEERADAIEDQEGDAEDAVAELADALVDFEAGVDRAEHDALEEVRSLGQSAQAGAEERMAHARSEVNGARGDFDEVLDDGSARIEEAHSGLAEGGFDAFTVTLAAVESALDQDVQESVAAFDGLEGAIGEAGTRIGAAYSDAEGALDDTIEESASQESVASGHVNDSLSGLEASGMVFDASCQTNAQELVDRYTSSNGLVAKEALDFEEARSVIVDEAVAAVDAMAADELAQPAGEIEDLAFALLLATLDDLKEALDDASQVTTGELPLLVDDLEKALAVMQTIGELLAALE